MIKLNKDFCRNWLVASFRLLRNVYKVQKIIILRKRMQKYYGLRHSFALA